MSETDFDFIQTKRPFVQPPVGTAFDPKTKSTIDTVDFDYDAVDHRQVREDGIAFASNILRAVLEWAWDSRKPSRRFKTALRRLTAMSCVMRPELVGNLGYREIGRELGCTKANLSKAGIQFAREFGDLRFRRQHKGRGNMRAAAIAAHRRQKIEEAAHQTQRHD